MYLPIMSESQTQRVKIPALSGGFNPGNAGDSINDNQLTDCKNVWYRGGEVMTRPKLNATVFDTISSKTQSAQEVEIDYEGNKLKFFVTYDNNALYCSCLSTAKLLYISNYGVRIKKFVAYKGKPGLIYNYGDLGLYVAFSDVDGNFKILEYYFDSETFTSSEAKNLSDVAYKPKVIINGLGNLYNLLPRVTDSEFPKTTQLEGFNLLSGGYRASFTTDSISNGYFLPTACDGRIEISINVGSVLSKQIEFSSEVDDDKFNYKLSDAQGSPFFNSNGERVETITFKILPVVSESIETYRINGAIPFYSTDGAQRKLRYYYNVEFKAKINRETGEITFPVKTTTKTILPSGADATAISTYNGKNENGKKRKVDLTDTTLVCIGYEYDADLDDAIYSKYIEVSETYKAPRFYSLKSDYDFVFPRCGGIHNNMEVTVSNSIDENEIDKILNCNINTAYGGSVGINYSTRTFLAGNKNSVYFSDIENPLYFPENCYLNIESKSPVTAFAQMGGYLIIYKKSSVYYTYETKLETSSEDVTNQNVVDITAQYMYQVKSLSPEIGCDLPHTIQMCMNRLIWTNKNGNTYSIGTLNNYSERNIYIVGGVVSNEIVGKLNDENCDNVFSCDWQGYYMLFIANSNEQKTYVYLLDYNRNAYKYISSYTADNNKYFSWWKWELPYLQSIVSNDADVCMINDNIVYSFDIEKLEDNALCFIQTKFFDFGAPDYYKGIDLVSIEFGNNYDTQIEVDFLTEKGESINQPTDIYNTGSRGTASYLRERNFYPKIRLCRKFGIKMSAYGPMSFSSVVINYQMKGRIKNGI